MTKKKKKRSQPTTVPNSQADEKHTAAGFEHYTRLAMVCVGVALAVVAAATYLSPPDEVTPDPRQQGEMLAPPEATITLPVTAVDAPNEQLRDEAVAEVEALQSQFPNHPGAMHVAAMLYAGLQQTEKAEEIWKQCIALDSRYVGPRVGLANVLTDRGQDEQAVEILTAAIEDNCVSPQAYHLLAEVLTKLGRLTEAEATLQEGLKRYPDVSELWFLLGQTQNQLQQFAAAEMSLKKALALGHGSPTIYFALSNACVRQGKKDEAAEYRKRFGEMKAASAQETEDQPFHERYGGALRPMVTSTIAAAAAVHAKENDPSEAERLFVRALNLMPDNPQILGELAALYLRTGRLADTKAVHERLVELEPENAYHHINLASVAAELGDFGRAEAALKRAIELKPDSALPQISLAQLYLQSGNFAMARSVAENSIRLTPTAQGYGILAAAAQALGDTATARIATETAQRLAAGGPPRQNTP